MSDPKPAVRRSLRAIVAVASLALAALAVAAGVSLTKPSAPRSSPEAASAPTSPLPGLGKKLVMLTLTPHVRTAETQAKWFQEETGTVVQTKVVNYDELRSAVERDQASGAPQIDVFYVFYTELPALIEKGALMDVTEYIEQSKSAIKPDDFIPKLYDASSLYRGKRWALPIDGDAQGLFYRKSIFAKYNLSPPKTWDDYLAAARTITENEKDKGVYGTAIMAYPVPILMISTFMNRLVTYGGDLLDRDGKPTLDSPEAVMALSALVEQTKYALPSPLETDFDASRQAFLSGRVAMIEQWMNIGIMAEDATQSTIRGDWGLVQLPIGAGPKARRGVAMDASLSFAVAATTKEPELARRFLEFSTRPDIHLRLNLLNGGIDPVRVSTLDAPEYQKFAPEVCASKKESLDLLVPWPTRPELPELLEALVKHLTKALQGKVPAKEALASAQAEWIQMLASKPAR